MDRPPWPVVVSVGVLMTAAMGAGGFVFVITLAIAAIGAILGFGSPNMAGAAFVIGLVFLTPAAVVSWGLWRSKRWGWWGVLTLLLGLALFVLGLLLDRMGEGFDAFLLVVGLVCLVVTGGAAALLLHPDARDWAWD